LTRRSPVSGDRQLPPFAKIETPRGVAQREVGHSAFLYGITGRGSTLVLHPPIFDPGWIAHDAPILATY
jgi:hypothetical protein